jgi:hypothetical protein
MNDKDSTIELENINEFYKFLQGEIPKSIKMTKKSRPNLTKEQAFSVIWFLQEHMQVLPERFEYCNGCQRMFDTHDEGYSVYRGRLYGDECCNGGRK